VYLNVYLIEEIKTQEGFEEIMDRSPALQTGTGKELVARAIHSHSRHVHELADVIECSVIVSRGSSLEPGDWITSPAKDPAGGRQTLRETERAETLVA
jgi:hypothetical protein